MVCASQDGEQVPSRDHLPEELIDAIAYTFWTRLRGRIGDRSPQQAAAAFGVPVELLARALRRPRCLELDEITQLELALGAQLWPQVDWGGDWSGHASPIP